MYFQLMATLKTCGSVARALAISVGVVLAAAVVPAMSAAATFEVDTGADTSLGACSSSPADCTLRDAITAANATTTADVIDFDPGALPLGIALDDPLPPVTRPLTIDAGAANVFVRGSAAYESTYCGGTAYALDASDPGAAPTSILALPVYNVCGRAIKSSLSTPTLAVGPRRADGTLPIGGGAPGASRVDVFGADGPDTSDREGDALLATAAVVGDVFAFVPGVEPSPGDLLTATATGALGTSGFSQRVRVPDDVVSPVLLDAVAVSNARVRLDFNEAVSGASADPAAFRLAIGGIERPLVAGAVSGNSVFIDSGAPWKTGEAGDVTVARLGVVTDFVGNQLIGQPTVRVFAGPGEIDTPVISGFRLTPNRFCKTVTPRCKRKGTRVLITLNKPARVVFQVLRGTARKQYLVTFVKRLKQGRNSFRFDANVSGRRLPATVMTLRATAQDVARTWSAPVETPFRVVTHKRDL